MHSPFGNNNQQGVEGASRTSDNAAKNWSPPTGCCCKHVRALAGVVPTEPSYHAPAFQYAEQHLVKVFHLSIALSMVSGGSALLYAKSGTKFLHQGRRKVGTLITQ